MLRLTAVTVSCILLLFARGSLGQEEEETEEYVEYGPFDGWFNNLAHPDWGAGETQLFRRVPPAYSDGVYEPSGKYRPNPIEISDIVFAGETGTGSFRNRTALLVFFGQQMVEEILDAQRPGCPPEYFNIPIPKNHSLFDKEGKGDLEMPLLRSRYDMNTGFSPNTPRMQLNEISAYIDGTLMYGNGKAWTDALRKFEDGRLKTFNDSMDIAGTFPAINDIRLPMANPPPPRQHKLEPIKRFYMLGNPRGNENPFLLTFGVLWFRYHNYQANLTQTMHPDWTDEQIFNEARKWTIATHQAVVMYDWLPKWLGINSTDAGMPEYDKYDPTVHPGIAHVFQTSAMRFGHTLVPPGVYRRSPYEDGNCTFYKTTDQTVADGKPALRTCNTYWNPQEGVNEHDIDGLLMGMASQKAEAEDTIITPDLRDDVFGPLEFSRRPLMAINIQRARDHGVPDYNTVRKSYGLDPITDLSEVNPDLDPDLIGNLSALYNNSVDDLDLWPIGMMETTEAGPGETFRTIILDQFRRIRDGDRFWFENKNNRLFNESEIEQLRNTTIKDVILAVTNIRDQDIQDDPFDFTDAVCPQPDQLSAMDMENCTDLDGFDYFDGSEVSYALSFFFLFATIPLFIVLLLFLANWRNKQFKQEKSKLRKSVKRRTQAGQFLGVEEWVGKKEGYHDVKIFLNSTRQQILVQSVTGKCLRAIDLAYMHHENRAIDVILSADKDMRMVQLKFAKEYDLVLRFDSTMDKDNFHQEVTGLLSECGLGINSPQSVSEKSLKTHAFTRASRQALLDTFFRTIFAHAIEKDIRDRIDDPDDVDLKIAEDVLNCELTRYEFAEALALKPDSVFVTSMFQIVDKDNNGFVSFREFLDLFVILSKGSADDKAKLMFDMYDLDGDGALSREEFQTMIKSLVELGNDSLDDAKMKELTQSIFASTDKDVLTFSDYNKILKDFKDDLNYAGLSLNVDGGRQGNGKARESGITRARKTIMQAYKNPQDEQQMQRRRSALDTIQTVQAEYPTSQLGQGWYSFRKYFATYRLHIFWLTLYTLVTAGIALERAYFYSVEREHAGLRRIAGLGVSITRGAASGMMFTYSCLLVTMCRNTITFLRETFLHRFIPFDAAVAFHKYIAYLALGFTVMHCIGHALNFYHISTQTADDLTCLFRNFFHATDELPKFHYWLWTTITGVTGVLATLVIIIMFTFSVQYARRNTYNAFWITHHLYIVLFILMFLHGAGRLVQAPFMYYFFLGPGILFTLDKLVSISRKKVEIAVTDAALLPSDVTKLEFQRPLGFDYKSGQWVRIACLAHNSLEYHPFTLTSAPHEDTLSLHIRAVGPWTTNIRKIYDPEALKDHGLPKIFLDGPFGEGHQDWYRYEVAVLVGGGIGVTPFASILKDIINKKSKGEKITCKKVYFMWVTRTQKSFEWLTDIIREVEEKDKDSLVNVHIFITQFKEKFDFRTTMLYICERYFQKVSQRSLFTGLRSTTHFGRPSFADLLKAIQSEHSNTDVFGVFSCGPPPMTLDVDKACQRANQHTSSVLFKHHFENF